MNVCASCAPASPISGTRRRHWTCAKRQTPPRPGVTVRAGKRLQVVFVTTEVAPWSKVGGLGDVMAALPAALAARGHRVMTVSPMYSDYVDVRDTGVRVPVQVPQDTLFAQLQQQLDEQRRQQHQVCVQQQQQLRVQQDAQQGQQQLEQQPGSQQRFQQHHNVLLHQQQQQGEPDGQEGQQEQQLQGQLPCQEQFDQQQQLLPHSQQQQHRQADMHLDQEHERSLQLGSNDGTAGAALHKGVAAGSASHLSTAAGAVVMGAEQDVSWRNALEAHSLFDSSAGSTDSASQQAVLGSNGSSSSGSSSNNGSSSSRAAQLGGYVRYYMCSNADVDHVFIDHPLYRQKMHGQPWPGAIVSVYSHPGSGPYDIPDMATAASVLCQAAVAAPVLLWGRCLGQQGQQSSHHQQQLEAALLLQTLGFDNKQFAPAVPSIQDGSNVASLLAVASVHKTDQLAMHMQHPLQIIDGVARPVLWRPKQKADRQQVLRNFFQPRHQRTPGGSSGSSSSSGHGSNGSRSSPENVGLQGASADPLVFVANDWPCGVLPLWLDAYRAQVLQQPGKELTKLQLKQHQPQAQHHQAEQQQGQQQQGQQHQQQCQVQQCQQQQQQQEPEAVPLVLQAMEQHGKTDNNSSSSSDSNGGLSDHNDGAGSSAPAFCSSMTELAGVFAGYEAVYMNGKEVTSPAASADELLEELQEGWQLFNGNNYGMEQQGQQQEEQQGQQQGATDYEQHAQQYQQGLLPSQQQYQSYVQQDQGNAQEGQQEQLNSASSQANSRQHSSSSSASGTHSNGASSSSSDDDELTSISWSAAAEAWLSSVGYNPRSVYRAELAAMVSGAIASGRVLPDQLSALQAGQLQLERLLHQEQLLGEAIERIRSAAVKLQQPKAVAAGGQGSSGIAGSHAFFALSNQHQQRPVHHLRLPSPTFEIERYLIDHTQQLAVMQQFLGRQLSDAKVAFAIHNHGYQGTFRGRRAFDRLGLPAHLLSAFVSPAGQGAGQATGAVQRAAKAAPLAVGSHLAALADALRRLQPLGNSSSTEAADCIKYGLLGKVQQEAVQAAAAAAEQQSQGQVWPTHQQQADLHAACQGGELDVQGLSASTIVVAMQLTASATGAATTVESLKLAGLRSSKQQEGWDQQADPESEQMELNWLRAGVSTSDAVVTVSRGYAAEMLTGKAGAVPHNPDLAAVIAAKQLQGILNGLDIDCWDPAKDPLLPQAVRYSHATAATGKAAAKHLLQRRLGLAVKPDVPLFVFVGRLTPQKGVDVILAAVSQVLGPSKIVQAVQLQEVSASISNGSDSNSGSHGVSGTSCSSSGNGSPKSTTDAGEGLQLNKDMHQPDLQVGRVMQSARISRPAERTNSVLFASLSSGQQEEGDQWVSGARGACAAVGAAAVHHFDNQLSLVPAAADSAAAAGTVNYPAQLVLLGAGDKWMEAVLSQLAGRYPGWAIGMPGFNEPLAHLLLAAADYLLVPSRYEPCGLVALAGLKYGAVPIATATGGLADIVSAEMGYTLLTPGAEGDTTQFRQSVAALVSAMQWAIVEYGTDAFAAKRAAAMSADVSWDKPAAEWEQMLQQLMMANKMPAGSC